MGGERWRKGGRGVRVRDGVGGEMERGRGRAHTNERWRGEIAIGNKQIIIWRMECVLVCVLEVVPIASLPGITYSFLCTHFFGTAGINIRIH